MSFGVPYAGVNLLQIFFFRNPIERLKDLDLFSESVLQVLGQFSTLVFHCHLGINALYRLSLS